MNFPYAGGRFPPASGCTSPLRFQLRRNTKIQSTATRHYRGQGSRLRSMYVVPTHLRQGGLQLALGNRLLARWPYVSRTPDAISHSRPSREYGVQ